MAPNDEKLVPSGAELVPAEEAEYVQIVQPFPVISLEGADLTVRPREYGTLVEHPQPVVV